MLKINYKRLLKLLFLTIFLLSPLYYIVLAGDQIRSNVFLVGNGSQTGQISTPIDLPVSLFIGNDLTGVTNPIKRSFFRISGVYTGGGTIQFKINGETITAKDFVLPNVTRPTDFEFIYRDDSGLINPTSAGSYDYILNVIPSGVSVSGLAAKLEVTYQFAPTPCVDGDSNNQKIKSVEFYVGQLSSLSTDASLPVSVYIGDELLGVNNPVKSAYFVVSGIYTGSGALSFNIDSASSNSFSLAGVTNPTNFNLIYKDKDNFINPATSGNYNYNLNISQLGLNVSNLNIKLILTYRYKPVSCGVGYPVYGDLVSAVYDSTSNSDGAAYNSIMWRGVLGGATFDQGRVLFQLAAADNSAGPWNFIGGSTCSVSDWYDSVSDSPVKLECYDDFNNKRYFRYKVRICSDDCLVSGISTPVVDEVIINYSP